MNRNIKKVALCLAFVAASTAAAFAQSPQQQISPSEAAIQVDTMVNSIASLATNQGKMIESLQKQIRDQQQEIADLLQKLNAAKVPPVASAVPLPPVPPH
jgi:TolA-binding protein